MRVNIILFVRDQEASTEFYGRVLAMPPSLHVPGMTEFTLTPDTVLGLMPSAGICRLLSPTLRDPDEAHGIPRAELYLSVDDPGAFFERALANGAEALSPLARRDWGDEVAYCADLDGHILAFAELKTEPS
ncbi:MAG: VOC family protein [Methanoregulaceae archaeon]|nr:VOC family protein [Methanoregulaceae archaeon]